MAETKPKLRDMDLINYRDTQKAIKILNESKLLGEETIKAVGIPKEQMVDQFIKRMKAVAKEGKEEEIPQECVDFYNLIHSPPTEEEQAEAKKKSSPKKTSEAKTVKKYKPGKWAVGFSKLLRKGGGEKKKLATKLAKAAKGNDPEAAYQVRTLACILIELGFAEETDDNVIQLTESASKLISK